MLEIRNTVAPVGVSSINGAWICTAAGEQFLAHPRLSDVAEISSSLVFWFMRTPIVPSIRNPVATKESRE